MLLARGERRVRVLRRAPKRRPAQSPVAGLAVEIIEEAICAMPPRARCARLTGIKSLYHVAADYRLWVPGPGR